MSVVAPWGQSKPQRLVGGIDLGGSGAIALVDAHNERLIFVCEMPTYKKQVGKTKRNRIDYPGLRGTLDMLADLGMEVLFAENPGAGFGASGRELGEYSGAVKMWQEMAKAQIEWFTPAKWKQKMLVPADKKEACLRADALFPHDRDKLRGPKGGRDDGKAEAAMIGLYGARHLLPGLSK